jgi:hypothetical protein
MLLVLAGAVSILVPPELRAQSEVEEYKAKAAFLFHFAQFAEWPPETFKDPNAPLTFCIFGQDPFLGALDDTVNRKLIGIRTLRVQHLKQAQEVTQACQILFIGTGERKRIPALVAALKEFPVLTVGETENFVREGGMIGFCLEGNKMRFEINLGAAGRAKLKISARLLALAKTVVGNPGGD